MFYYVQTIKGVTLLLSATTRKQISSQTHEAIARYGKCEVCHFPLLSNLSSCTNPKRSHLVKDAVWFSPKDFEQFEPFVELEKRREKNQYRLESRNFAMQSVAGFHRPEDIQTIWTAQQENCYYCGKRLETTGKKAPYVKDHIVPVASEGSEWPSNIALTCFECNSKKSSHSQTFLWNYLAKTRGDPWVSSRKEAGKEVKKVRDKLARLRKSELASACSHLEEELRATIEKYLSEKSISSSDEVYVEVSDSRGIDIEYGGVTINFPPSSHRLIIYWNKNDWQQIADIVIHSAVLMKKLPFHN